MAKTIISKKSVKTTSPNKVIAKVKKVATKRLTPTKRRAITAPKNDAKK